MRIALLLSLALVVMGCSDDLLLDDGAFVQSDMTGSVRIPLLASSASGVSYRLTGATFEISGAAMVTISEQEAGADAEQLRSPLPPGGYSMYLRPGWQVIAIAADGTMSPLPAVMVSTNPVNFHVGQMGDVALTLQFKSGDRALVFGAPAPLQVTSASLTPSL